MVTLNIPKAKRICLRLKQLKAERENWENWWQQIAKYCVPRAAEITTRKESGTQYDADVYDSTARDSIKVFAAGLMGHLTSPSTPWFKLRTTDERIMEADGVRSFFSRAEKKIRSVFHDSNFYQQLHEFYIHIGTFGTAVFYSEEDVQDLIRYYSRPIREVYFEEDERGRLRSIYRVFELTALQAFEKWGTAAGKEVSKCIEKKEYSKKFDFCHYSGPRDVRDPKKKDKKNMEIESVWLNIAEERKIDEGGFREQAFSVARFCKESQEKHGFSPAMDVLPDIKSANRGKYNMLRAAAKAIDPAILLPHENFILPLDFNPAAVNYRQSGTGTSGDESIEILGYKGDWNIGRDSLLDDREIIKRGFFVDLFLMLLDRKKTMTATEVAERVQEKMFILGPVLGRLQTELLEPVITRTFNILLRNGHFGDVPQALLQASGYKIEYLGMLAKAQRMAEIKAIEGFLQIVAGIAQVDPKVVHKINGDMTVDEAADILGIDPKLLNDDKTVKTMREALAKQQEMAQRIEMARLAGDAGQSVGKAGKEMKNITEEGGANAGT